MNQVYKNKLSLNENKFLSYVKKNLQRYAYAPLVDGESEDEEEDLLPKTTTKTKLTENIKKRGDKGGYEKVDQDEKMVNKKYKIRVLILTERSRAKLFI